MSGMRMRAMCNAVGVRRAACGGEVAGMPGWTMPSVKMACAGTDQTAEDREQESRREAADEAGYEHPVHRCVHFHGPGLLSSR